MIFHFQNEKCHLLVEHETQKLKELDEEHSQELKEWREKLRPRKKVKLQIEKYRNLNRMLYLEEKYLFFYIVIQCVLIFWSRLLTGKSVHFYSYILVQLLKYCIIHSYIHPEAIVTKHIKNIFYWIFTVNNMTKLE